MSTPIAHYKGFTEANGFIFCSGQVGVDDSGQIVAGIESQTLLAIQNLKQLLLARGQALAIS